MVTLSRKAKYVIQGSILAVILVFLVVIAVFASTGIYANYNPKYSPPDPKASIHIAADGSITAPATYNETVPIERNGDQYTLTGDINLTVIVDRSNIVIDGGGFSVATKFQPGQGSPGFGLKLLDVSNVTVENVHSAVGLKLEQARNCTVADSSSVILYQSSGNIVSNCAGWILNFASNNRIEHCRTNEFDIEYSNSNYILYCNCTGPGRSILMWGSSNNVLFGNVFSNAWWWINMGGGSSNNYFVANNITVTQKYGGDELSGTNYIYHNNFLQWSWNQSATDNSANIWSQGGRGNYYAGYAQVDANHDGIIDVPFTIDKNNVDNYPLMEPVDTATEPLPTLNP